MTHDPDLLAIQRKRRQQGRCLTCGTRNAYNAALCRTCRVQWRYCPRCERVHPLDESTRRDDAGRSTSYCVPCSNIQRVGVKPSRAEHVAAERERVRARVAKALPLYRRGVPTREIAAKLGLTPGALAGLINYARRIGLWPPDLRRRRPNTQNTREP